jgi:hypothetical protein
MVSSKNMNSWNQFRKVQNYAVKLTNVDAP